MNSIPGLPAPSDLCLRNAADSDAFAIARLIRESKKAAMPWLPVVHSLEEDVGWVSNVLLREQVVTLVTHDEDLVGVLATTPGWVEQLYVSPGQQGRGIGSLLLRSAMDAAAGPIRLWTFQRNLRARRFYERHGFVVVGTTDGENEEKQPDVLYQYGTTASDEES
ncbi:GNAT family N-acetyltransferase [Microbacterium sp. K41]|uniref:GNAT family N-acetyltransferase n=1 Tax=Microbacterium sp. K41 TaxID=2305437 RepID=UPI001443DBC9|nr:GNAT family N-acetyltransferase [Microbacterium sp. K41]